MEREKIVCFQDRQLRRVVTYAYENVPYYRRLFDREGLKPQDIRTVDDLSAIPITSKSDLQMLHARELVSRRANPEHLIVLRTGGSTGKPMVVRRTWTEERLLQAFRWRSMHYFGQRSTDHIARISFIEETHPRDYQFVRRSMQAVGLYKWTSIDCRFPLEDILGKLQDLNPDILKGYPGVLHRLSHILEKNSGKPICPRFVAVGGEVLTPLMREHIREAFGAPVFDVYGSYESNLLAWECKETGELHTCDDCTIVEVLKNGSPSKEGEQGEVVATNLHSFAMPFIRYRLDDIVTKGTDACKCGQPFSTIRNIQGRIMDYFLLPGGRLIHPWEISYMIDTASWIRQYRLIQEREDRIVSQIVPKDNAPEQEMRKIESFVKERVGASVEFRIELVPEIQFEPNGKFRIFRSLVMSD
ncbi:MAG: phenylacetate--CoA ligase family protein [Deltaproteobacteria bacterium]|nr:phenylacetate--CoA ligase family protein [Deltaproteobacteria bacterium]